MEDAEMGALAELSIRSYERIVKDVVRHTDTDTLEVAFMRVRKMYKAIYAFIEDCQTNGWGSVEYAKKVIKSYNKTVTDYNVLRIELAKRYGGLPISKTELKRYLKINMIQVLPHSLPLISIAQEE